MKKVLLFIVTFLFAMTVNAKYKEYSIGEVVVINDRPYMVVSNSDIANSKLVLIDYDNIYVSNYDELYDEYVRGGVEVIYEHIFEEAEDVDGYLMNLYGFIDDFNNRYNVEIESFI